MTRAGEDPAAPDTTDALCERATRLSAEVTVAPTDTPKVRRFSCWLGPQQASIVVLQAARRQFVAGAHEGTALAPVTCMPIPPQQPSKKRAGSPDKKSDPKQDQAAEEVLREQSKTETEERPYLDTEGGE